MEGRSAVPQMIASHWLPVSGFGQFFAGAAPRCRVHDELDSRRPRGSCFRTWTARLQRRRAGRFVLLLALIAVPRIGDEQRVDRPQVGFTSTLRRPEQATVRSGRREGPARGSGHAFCQTSNGGT